MEQTDSDQGFEGVIGRYASESFPSWPRPVEAKPGSPNFLVIVLDDVGFAHLGCYGSPIETPNMDRLARRGLLYANFHAPPICGPSRASLMTGRNHHAVGMGHNPNWDSGFPNGKGAISPTAATMAEILKSNGYSTFAIGKWHLAPLAETSAAGPFHNWPLQKGFERYYGFLDALTDQFEPDLSEDNHRRPRPIGTEYHLSEDLVDQSIAMLRNQRSLMPNKPFLLYLAFGACHAPLQAPPHWIAKYRGRFDRGWDSIREDVYRRQIDLGVIPPDAALAPRNDGVRPWDDLPVDDQHVAARLQEAFAGMLDHTDAQIGRLVEYLDATGDFENTVTILVSDNGAKAGSPEGKFIDNYNPVQVDASAGHRNIEKIGGPDSHSVSARGWSQVGNTPLKRYKINTHGGGVRVPMIMCWPARIDDAGSIRRQFHHMIDITPTILDIVGVEAPIIYQGIAQMPLHGTPMTYTFDDDNRPTTNRTQYFETAGHRAIWQEGWKAVAYHDPDADFEEDQWELYHLDADFSEGQDLAREHPTRLQELRDKWWSEAERYDVMPLDTKLDGRISLPPSPGTPAEHVRFRLYAGIDHIPTNAAPDTRNRSYKIIAAIERTSPDGDGVIVARGGITGGYSLYVQNRRLVFEYNHAPGRYRVVSRSEVAVGRSTVAIDFAKTGDLSGEASLYIDDVQVGSGVIARTLAGLVAIEGLDIGQDSKTSVSDHYRAPFPFQGTIHYVDFELGDDQSEPS